MSKPYPVEVLLSVTSGVLLCDFGKFHECVEFLAGQPVFTHQLAYRPFIDELKMAVLSQHPDLAAEDTSAITPENYRAYVEKWEKEPPLEIIPMAAMLDSMAASFTEPLKGKDVIILESNEDA